MPSFGLFIGNDFANPQTYSLLLYNKLMIKILKSIIGFSLKNKYFILVASLALVVIGIFTFRNMPIEAFPDVTNTEISIITQWPGRSAEEVEKFVTIPIEIAMNPVQQKISLRSSSYFRTLLRETYF